MPSIRSFDGVRISFEQTPGERPVLLLHGFASSAALTWQQTGWLRAFAAAGTATVSVDLRGHGYSDKPTDPAGYAMTAFLADIDAVLAEADYDIVDVFGYSMGARVALAFAQAHPERAGRLVLGGIAARDLFAGWNPDEVDAILLRNEPVADAQLTSIVTTARSVPGTSAEALSALVRGLDASGVSSAPQMPTLVAVGANDELAPNAADFAEQLSAELVEVPGRGHFNVLSARTFRESILRFLAAQV
ncbi:MAG: alpha/beta hydrolase [Subtercola sp.]|nr:alpha/beta hydrolase [Subtercola sp.]